MRRGEEKISVGENRETGRVTVMSPAALAAAELGGVRLENITAPIPVHLGMVMEAGEAVTDGVLEKRR